MSNSRRFEDVDHVDMYGKARPHVPTLIIDTILNYLSEKLDKNQWNIAVDVGCGSGQCTSSLSPYFNTVYGYDVSAAQIEKASKSDHPSNVFYGVSESENLSAIEPNSVQLITASTAAHWFDIKRFFTEVDRVLAPNGVVALFTYYFLFRPFDPNNPTDKTLTNLVKDVFYDPLMIQYKNVRTLNVAESKYRCIEFPHHYEYVYKDNIVITREKTVDQVISHIKSWSNYNSLLKNDATVAENFISNIEQKFRDILAVNDLSRAQILCNYDYFIAMGRKAQ